MLMNRLKAVYFFLFIISSTLLYNNTSQHVGIVILIQATWPVDRLLNMHFSAAASHSQ